MAEKKIICKKWTLQENGTFHCTQNGNLPCGCMASIDHPLRMDDILNDRQKEERRAAIAEIKESIRDRQAALVLGAGISQPSKMPTWNKLISQMMGYAIQYDQLNREGSVIIKAADSKERGQLLGLAKSLISKELDLLGNVNTLESAEYVAQFFDTATRDPDLRRCLEWRAIRAMVQRVIDQSLTPQELLTDPKTGLQADIEKCGPKASLPEIAATIGKREIAEKNTMFAVSYLLSDENGIRQAMTYNYDPLVQEYMMDLYGIGEEKMITHPGLWGKGGGAPDTREIYHVHGFIPGRRHLARGSQVFPDQSGPIVLSEDSYYRIEQEEAYNWSSSIQSYFLNRYQCIFVGFSADDYNFRRILRQIGEGKNVGPHYLILSVRKWISDTYEDVCRACLKCDEVKTAGVDEVGLEKISKDAVLLLQYILQCRALYWKRFNILPIWATREEIPALLTDLLP